MNHYKGLGKSCAFLSHSNFMMRQTLNEMAAVDAAHASKFSHFSLEEVEHLHELEDYTVVFIDEADYCIRKLLSADER